MDFGNLPDFANHFGNAVQSAIPAIRGGVLGAYDGCMNIWTGMTHPDAMPPTERNLQLLKLGSTSFGFYMAALGKNIHGAVGCSIAISETLLRLNRAGSKIRAKDL